MLLVEHVMPEPIIKRLIRPCEYFCCPHRCGAPRVQEQENYDILDSSNAIKSRPKHIT